MSHVPYDHEQWICRGLSLVGTRPLLHFREVGAVLSQFFWRLGVQTQGVGSAMLPSKALRENPSLPLPASGGFWCSLACGTISPISPPSSSLCVCVPVRTLAGFRSPPNPVASHPDPHPNSICKNPTSKQDRLPRFWRNMDFGGTRVQKWYA